LSGTDHRREVQAPRGYKGSGDLTIAIERGEVQGRAITWTTLRGDHPDWLSEKKVDVIVQLALKRNPELPEFPMRPWNARQHTGL
jgi:hypothetical protein